MSNIIRIVNLTPHAVVVQDSTGNRTTFPSEGVARLNTAPSVLETIPGIPVPVQSPVAFTGTVGLPDPVEGTFYIVSIVVAGGLKNRPDCLVRDRMMELSGSLRVLRRDRLMRLPGLLGLLSDILLSLVYGVP